jgi:hypothetical protein
MISALYTAGATKRLDLELKIIRHFLLHRENRSAREAFVEREVKEFSEGLKASNSGVTSNGGRCWSRMERMTSLTSSLASAETPART